MEEILIIPEDIVKYMGEDNYSKFVDEIENKFNSKCAGFWLIAQKIARTKCQL